MWYHIEYRNVPARGPRSYWHGTITGETYVLRSDAERAMARRAALNPDFEYRVVGFEP